MSNSTPLVLLHPFPADATFWDPLLTHMQGGRPVLRPEAPGFGDAPRRDGWSIADTADDVARHLAAWAPGGRAVVMGLSMGGYIALALVSRHPETVAGLVLADTRAEPDDDAALATRADAIARIEAEGTAQYLAAFLPRLLAPDADHHTRDALAAIAARQAPHALTGALRALAGRVDRRPDLPAVACPTLVMVGEHDAVTPHAAARVMADGIPGARLEVVAEAGHMTALERPEAVALLVERHLAGIVT